MIEHQYANVQMTIVPKSTKHAACDRVPACQPPEQAQGDGVTVSLSLAASLRDFAARPPRSHERPETTFLPQDRTPWQSSTICDDDSAALDGSLPQGWASRPCTGLAQVVPSITRLAPCRIDPRGHMDADRTCLRMVHI